MWKKSVMDNYCSDKVIDETGIDNFAIVMKEKMATAREKGRSGWHDKNLCSNEYLSQLLREHVEKGDPIDVANLCMMLEMRNERIKDVRHEGFVRHEDETDIVFRLRKRAEIRRQIPTRKSVQENKPDRIADLLEEAADEIEKWRPVPLEKKCC